MRSMQRGLTLAETMMTTAIAAVAAGMAAPSFTDFLQRRRIEGLAAEVAADLQFVRMEALARQRGIRISFESDATGTTCYVIHTGGPGDCRCLAGVPATCDPSAIAIKTQHFATGSLPGVRSNVASMLYDPTFGTVSPTATVTIGTVGRTGVRHVVSLLGRVRTCSPPGGLPGYRAC
jgi:type IV fimbrial biogenesis protein FimT